VRRTIYCHTQNARNTIVWNARNHLYETSWEDGNPRPLCNDLRNLFFRMHVRVRFQVRLYSFVSQSLTMLFEPTPGLEACSRSALNRAKSQTRLRMAKTLLNSNSLAITS
jgi:hypothetical protein